MKQKLSTPRRIARSVFVGLGAIFLMLIPLSFTLDKDVRYSVANHEFANRLFREALVGSGLWLVLGSGFFVAAYSLRNAGVWGLSSLIILNLLLLSATGRDSKDLILLPPLVLSLVCLIIEESRVLASLRRKTA